MTSDLGKAVTELMTENAKLRRELAAASHEAAVNDQAAGQLLEILNKDMARRAIVRNIKTRVAQKMQERLG